MTIVDRLKKLAVKLGCAESVAKVTGDTTAEVIAFIEDKYAFPALPTEAGSYKLVVDAEGNADWAEITG